MAAILTEPQTTGALALAVQATELARALKTVSRVAPAKHALFALTTVQVEARGEQLLLSANNLEQMLRLSVPAEIEDEGALCLPAKLLADFVDSLEGGELALRQEPGQPRVELRSGRYRAHLSGVSAADFPPVPQIAGALRCALPARRLKLALEQTGYALATDDTRPVLAALWLRVDPEAMRLTLAGADGFRLAVRDVPLVAAVSAPEAPRSVLLPRPSVRELHRLLPETDDEVRLSVPSDGQFLRASWGAVELVSVLTGGEYPDYQRIIPQETPTRVVVATDELLAAVRIASVFSRDNSYVVRLTVTPSAMGMPGLLAVDSSSAEYGDQHSRLEVTVEGEESSAAFNGRFLREALEAMGSREVTLHLSGPPTPVKLEPGEGAPAIHVIMPMHVRR